ncbi:MAG TPA: DUF2339 domain-containing protein [Blastocatellia bacterium]|nr:DUF2339 domain-containing protein [Blastocatellia bacterium]
MSEQPLVIEAPDAEPAMEVLMAEDKPSPEIESQIAQLSERLSYLELAVREQLARLHAIERRLGFANPPEKSLPYERLYPASGKPERRERVSKPSPQVSSPADGAPIATPPTAIVSDPLPAKSLPTAVHPITEATRAEQMQQTRRAGETSRTGPDLESRIGGRWLLWIGIIAISFGVAFFLKFAFDNQWITPGWRVNIGVMIGLAFLVGGERLRRRYPVYSHGLSGGGIFILYLSIFVGFNTYHLIPQPLAFALMAAVTATASLLAARYSALAIAVLGLIGGFLTPILLSTGVDNEIGLFGYIALLDLGVLALAYSKRWRSLNYMAFIATVVMFVAWMFTWYATEKLWTTVFFLTVFFMIFALLAVLHNVVNRRPIAWLELAMVFSNALLYFSTSYELLEDKYHKFLGLFAVLVSAFYMGLGYFTYSRDREDKLLIYTFLGLALLFAVLAVPIQLDQHWVTMAWALEGVALTWIGLKANDKISRYAALVVFGVALSHWFWDDMREFAYHTNESFLPLLNRRALSCGVLVAALAAGSIFFKRITSTVEDEERSMFTGLYLLAANALAVILLSVDASDYFEQSKTTAGGDQSMSIGNTKALTLTAIWAAYGVATLFVGVTRRLKLLRYLAIVLLAGASVKVLVVDLSYYDASWHTLILNQTFAAFALVTIALALCARFYARGLDADDEERDIMLALLIGAANVLAIIALTAEVLGYFDRGQTVARGEAVTRLENAKQLALSTLWTIYGSAVFFVGIKRKLKPLRWGGLILLAAVIFKLWINDLRFYRAPWHALIFNETFAAFALLIGALALIVRLYSRAEDIEEEERSAAPVIVAVANVLAIVMLSTEVLGYFGKKLIAGDAAAEELRDLGLAQQLWLSLVWTIYGGAMLTVGIARRSKLLRVMALLLLGLTIFKVFLFDLSSLEKLYRIISFVVLGAILLAVSFLYQRYRQRLAEFIGGEDAQAPVGTE